MPFLNNAWYVFGFASELADGAMMHRTICEEPILVWRKADGAIAAIRDLCPHRFVPLSRGKLVGDVVQCGYHGLRFGSDGICVHNPIPNAPIPGKARVPSFPASETHGLLWVWLGDRDLADEGRIPGFSFLVDASRSNVGGYTLVDADYQLCIDNLSDLTHAQFVHEEYQASEAFDRLEFEVEQDEDTVYTRFVFPNGRPAAFFRNAVADPEAPYDLILETRWNAPSCVRLDGIGYPVGERGNRLFTSTSAHILTAQTERTSHYFYINSRTYAVGDQRVDEAVRGWQRRGFAEEDKPMIEAQQRCIRDADIMTLGPVLLPTDAGAIRVRRVLAALMKAEGLPTAPAERV